MLASERAFSLVEVMLVVLTISVMAVSALLGTTTAFRRYQLESATRTVAAQVRSARLRAVTANETMRVRFNCPAPGQLRIVQLVGTPAIDNAADRCSAAVIVMLRVSWVSLTTIVSGSPPVCAVIRPVGAMSMSGVLSRLIPPWSTTTGPS